MAPKPKKQIRSNVKTKIAFYFLTPLMILEFCSKPYLDKKQEIIDFTRGQQLRLEHAYLTYTGQSTQKAYTESDLKQLAALKASQYKLNPLLVEALVSKESKWNPEAVSYRGALGLTQVMPSWKGKNLCPSYSKHSDLFDPEKNLDCGLAILSYNIKTEGSVRRGLQAYNGGPSCLKNKGCFDETNRYAMDILNEVNSKLVM